MAYSKARRLADLASTSYGIADDKVTSDTIANSINAEITANTAKVTNVTHTGEVTGATALTIADDTVDEANLKISNTGANGQVLSKQSENTGGLTWATVGGAYSNWDIITTTPTNLVAKGQYICNDTTARTHTLPAGVAKDTITVCNAGTGTVTLARTSSQKINSADADGTLPQGNSVQLVYVDVNIGWFEV
jgi:hypothetical protein